MSFERVELGEFIKVQGGYAYKSDNFQDDGDFPVLKIKNVRFGNVDYDEASYINAELADETIDWKTKEGDILISMTGSGPNAPNSLVGRVARIWDGEPDAWINQRVGRILLKEENSIHPDFIFYLLSSYATQHYLVSNSTGSANQANISGKLIETIPCPKVDYKTSKRIADQLRILDQKIHLNQQTNETLEAMAQAIFKSWFVDFDPVRAKIDATSAGRDSSRAAMAAIAGVSLEQPTSAEASEGRSAFAEATEDRDWDEIEAVLDQKLGRMTDEQCQQLTRTAELFPDELVESEFGEVPKGWGVIELKKVIKNFDRKRVPLSRREREERPGKYPYYGATSIMDYVDDYLFEGRNVLMAEDGSVMDDDGKPVLQYIEGKIWVNNHAHVLNGKGPINNEVLYLFLQTVNISPYVTGAVQKKINQGNMNSIPFLLADEKLYEFISPIIKGFFDKIIQNENENQELESLRDTLLPKLISGEIQI